MLKVEIGNTIEVVIEIGKSMLQNGAETYRVEDTINRLLNAQGFNRFNTFVVPTCIIVTIKEGQEMATYLERVNPGAIDLEKIVKANQLSRDIANKQLSPREVLMEIDTLKSLPTFPKYIRYLGAGLAGGFFTLLFKGSILEFILSAIASIITVFIGDKASEKDVNFFFRYLVCGLIACILGIIAHRIFENSVHMDAIIIGPLMTLVPGVAFTNGIRDVISGEFLSGSTRIMEALFIAIGIAFGVGFALRVFS